VISGTTTDEYRLFVAEDYDLQGNPILTSDEYTAAVDALFPAALSPYVLEVYPFSNYPTGGQALGAAGTDGIFSCPVLNANQLLSAYVPTYAYEFADENAPPAQSDFGGALTFPLGAYHTSELQFLFKGFDVFGLPTTLSPQRQSSPRTCSSTGPSSRRRAIRTSLANRHGLPTTCPATCSCI
jgi:para-nitrobenzyl esterase